MDQTTSSTSIADIIADVRVLLNDSQSPYFHNDADILRYINLGRTYIARDSSGFQDTEDITLTTALEYTPTSNYLSILAVIYTPATGASKALVQGSPKSVGTVSTPGEPVYWYEYAGKVGVYPQLSAATTEKVTIYYVTLPTTTLSSSDNLDTPQATDTALVFYATGLALVKERKYAASAHMLGQADVELRKAAVALKMMEPVE